MQLFSSIHTISSWANSLAVHPASFPRFLKAISMVTFALEITPPHQMACSEGGQPVKEEHSDLSEKAARDVTVLQAPQHDWPWQGVVPRRGGIGVSCVSAGAGTINARRQAGRLAERVGT